MIIEYKIVSCFLYHESRITSLNEFQNEVNRLLEFKEEPVWRLFGAPVYCGDRLIIQTLVREN